MGVVGLEPAWNADHREPGPGPDRQPPQDLVAEQSVLGAMMISKDAIAEVIELVRSDDFYKPAHELIFDAVVHLYSLGEPADAITVAEQLTKRGDIARVGGHTYLYDLVASVSVAANAGYYAQIVRDKAVLRRLVQASIKIAQLGYNAEGDVDDIVDEAQATMYAIADRRTTEDYKPLEQLIEPTMDEMELIEAQGGVMSGVPTGFAELDELTAGLHSGQMIIIAARPGMGKALALDTPLPTPTGWTTMGDVRVGDRLLDAEGHPTTVVAATEVMTERPCYRITFSDGTTVVADAEHEWPAVATEAALATSGTHSSAPGTPVAAASATTTEMYATLDRTDWQITDRRHAGHTWTITAVERVDSAPVRCVQVDNAEHLYLATAAMIPTHNSTLGLDICRSASIKHGLTSCIFSLEMSQTEITMRMLSAEASVPLSHMRQGTMSSDEWDRVSGKASLIGSAPLYVDDSPNLTMMEIRAKARRLKQQHDLKLIVLDYLQLMSSGKKVESRQLEVSEFSRQMKLLAKELELPVIAISQLNRNPEKRDDKRPSVSDLRESGSLEQDADVIILVHRDDYYNKDDSDRVGEADIIVAKHRNGPTKTVTVAFQGHYSRFTDMAH